MQSSLAKAQSELLQTMMSSERTGGTATRDSLLTNNSSLNKNVGSTEPTPPRHDNQKSSQKRSLGQRQQVQVFEDSNAMKENPRPTKQQRRETDEVKDELPEKTIVPQEPEALELETESMIGDCLLSDYAR